MKKELLHKLSKLGYYCETIAGFADEFKKLSNSFYKIHEEAINIFNENNGTTHIEKLLQKDDLYVPNRYLVKKFKDNIYTVIRLDFNRCDEEFNGFNEVKLYKYSLNNTLELLFKVEYFYRNVVVRNAKKELLLDIKSTFVKEPTEGNLKLVLSDEKLINELAGIAGKLMEMNTEAHEELLSILRTIKDKEVQDILKVLWD